MEKECECYEEEVQPYLKTDYKLIIYIYIYMYPNQRRKVDDDWIGYFIIILNIDMYILLLERYSQ